MSNLPREASSPLIDLISITNQSLAYGIGILGRQLLIYAALPFFTHFMQPAAFGAVSVMTAFISFIDVFSNAGLPAATFRLYNETDDPALRRHILGSSFVLFGGFAVLLSAMAIFFARQVSSWLFDGSSAYANLITPTAVLMVVMTLINFGYITLRIQVRPTAVSLHSLALTVFQIGFSLLWVVFYHLEAWGYWMGQLTGALAGLLLMGYWIRPDLKVVPSWQALTGLLLFALPLVPATLAQWALRLVDRMVISHLVGLEQVAIYEVASRIALLSSIFLIPFANAWPQFAYSAAKRTDAEAVYRNVLTYVMLGAITPAIGVFLLSPQLLHVFAPSGYDSAMQMIPWLLLAQIAWGIYPVLTIGLLIRKKTLPIAVTMLIAVGVHLVLLFRLIPIFGAVGAAMSSFIAYAVLAVETLWASRRYYNLQVDWMRLGRIAFASVIPIATVILLGWYRVDPRLDLSLRASSTVPFLAILVGREIHNVQALFRNMRVKA